MFAALLSAAIAQPAIAQQALPDLSLEELMRIDSGRVFGASERIQPVTEAPSSVSFITAEEIERYGYRTLADILRGVRGMYVTDDRNFSLLGARGFAKPGDYNSRILLLVNGHRVNDNVFGQAEIGAEFGIDPAMFERVEIIRGPASSLYGDSAFFAVVNVITKSGASLNGASVAAEVGSLETVLTRVSAGQRLANGVDLAVSGTYQGAGGIERLYFPAFDTVDTNHGIAQGLDGERLGELYGQLRLKNFVFTGAYGSRRKDVPTASFGTLFNNHTDKERTTDRHTLLDVEYGRAFGLNRVTLRGSFDQFSYDGTYPFAGDDPESVLVARNSVLGSRWTAGVRLARPLPSRQTLTAGAEVIDNVHQDQQTHYVDPASMLFDATNSSIQTAVYVQDEIKLTRWLLANGGLRYDAYEQFTRVTPRTALIATPSSNQSFKYLYGTAFRAPNFYELNDFYFGPNIGALRPESIDTHELVWERYTNDWLRTSASTYWYKADGLITATLDPTTFLGTTFVNGGHVRANGLELEAQMRLKAGVQGLASYALQRVKDLETGATLVNSPAQMVKLRVSMPGPLNRSSLAVEVLGMSSRRTLADATLGATATANMTFVAPLNKRFDLVGTVRNLFDAQYSDPASDAHLQDTIPQNGRTFRAGLRLKFAAR
ncbi:MAG TPA: TonB-dependent receptor [Vicinamibacterales bacterium]|nr:TonB-dependent receptor [Vicinamibacterales bacterium]